MGAAGNEVLVEQAVESRVVRGTGKKNCKKSRNQSKCKKCQKKGWTWAGGECKKGCKKCKTSGGKWRKGECVCSSNMRERRGECVEKQLQKKKLNRKTSAAGAKLDSGSRSTVNLTCLTKAIKLLKFQKDNVNNFLTRHTRQLKQSALSTKKQGKKGEFAEPAARLIQAGGGNKSNLTSLLESCSADIHAACTPPSGINQTFMSECYDKSKGFNTTLTGCVTTALSGADPCSCFT